MSNEFKKESALEIAHVLFIDIVGYSKLLINEQQGLLSVLNGIVRATDQFRAAEGAGRFLKIPTGDGMALVFYDSPETPVECALEIARADIAHPELQLRMGIHSGPVSTVVDVNQRANVAGGGINIAQRVMDCGDAGHILLSKRVAEDLVQYQRWQTQLHDLGVCEVKHGVVVSVVNLYTEEVGNPEVPEKFKLAEKRPDHGRLTKEGLFSELKRRNVLRIAAFYAASGWLLVQIATQVLPVFDVPTWAMRLVVVAVVLGFPFALVFSWFYELTPEGLKRENEVDRSRSMTRKTSRKLDRLIIGMLAAAVVALLATQFVFHKDFNDTALSKAIAVLPLVNDTGDPGNEYFSDGLSEELISALAQIKELKVIGRTSSFHFKNKNEQSKVIGTALDVGYLLEGSVRKSAGRARIAINLVRAADGANVWSQIYDRTLPDIFAVQAEIAQSVAGALKVALLGDADKNPDAPSNQNVDAYTAYLQGRYYERRYSAADLRKAIGFYDAAIRSDPHYALAYAALSKSWWALGDITGEDVTEANRKARAAAERAVAEDPNSAEGHAALGQILVSVDRNAKGAEVEFRRAAELAPASAEPKIGLASVIADFGKIEEAVELLHQAVQLEPLTANAHFDLARLLTSLGRYDEAVQSARKAIDLQPGGAGTWEMLALVEAKRGDGEAALRAAVQESDPDWRAYAMALAQQARGDAVAADEALSALIAGHSDDMSFQIATVYAFRGDADKTFEWLDRAYEKRDPGVMAIIDNPFTRELRSDPRFAAYCKKVGLPWPP